MPARGTPDGQVTEFKQMVKTLHAAGIEVILDVVYNHTAEGNHLGPTLSFRGIDNASYYRLVPEDPRFYMDYTGTGNTLNAVHPQVLQLIMDSLRYWVTEMHVDGFRFDLASALARELHDVDRLGSFFDVIHQDPVLNRVKLIGEPWDIAEGGYQVGNFPTLWSEWNDKYRDTVRDYWKAGDVPISELAYRLTGSSDLYQGDGRRPYASINFVTAHDGFTLHDLVSYNEKHNEANGENNRDGHDHNLSWNHGVEGPTKDPKIIAAREQTKRNLMATLLLSQGVPMLAHGDEIGRTQQGNNNVYAQDNEISWVDWNLDKRKRAFLEFTRDLIAVRDAHPSLGRPRFFQGRKIRGSPVEDLAWFRPGRRADDRRGVGRGVGAGHRHAPRRQGADRGRCGGQPPGRRRPLPAAQWPRRAGALLPAAGRQRRVVGRRRHRQRRGQRQRRRAHHHRRGRISSFPRARCCCCGVSARPCRGDVWPGNRQGALSFLHWRWRRLNAIPARPTKIDYNDLAWAVCCGELKPLRSMRVRDHLSARGTTARTHRIAIPRLRESVPTG